MDSEREKERNGKEWDENGCTERTEWEEGDREGREKEKATKEKKNEECNISYPTPLMNRKNKKSGKLGDREEEKPNSPLTMREVIRHVLLPATSAQLPHT